MSLNDTTSTTTDEIRLARVAEIDKEIRELNNRAKRLKTERDYILDMAEMRSLRDEPAPQGGRYLFVTMKKEVREIDPSRFAKAYPEEFWDCVTVSIGKADERIGKIAATQIADIRESEVRKVVFEKPDAFGPRS